MYVQWNTTQPQKKNEKVSFKITWMDLEGVMLSEINQTGKIITLCYHLYVGSEK